jgi:hypothetical protein
MVDDEIFNEMKASKYEEFDVIKINKRGVRQARILGIDQLNLYNKKMRNKKCKFCKISHYVGEYFEQVSSVES